MELTIDSKIKLNDGHHYAAPRFGCVADQLGQELRVGSARGA